MIPYILALLGLILIMLEFYLPGAVMGTSGALMLIVSIVVFASEHGIGLSLFGFVTFIVIFLSIIIRVTLKRIQAAAEAQTIYLNADQEGFTASEFSAEAVGKEGLALTDLKPSGHVVIEGAKHQAVSESAYITKGSSVSVTGGRGAYLVVQQKDPTS